MSGPFAVVVAVIAVLAWTVLVTPLAILIGRTFARGNSQENS